jgi:microcystin-dependent protein
MGSREPLGEWFATGVGVSAYASQGPLTQLNPGAITTAGGDAPHNNLMPYHMAGSVPA